MTKLKQKNITKEDILDYLNQYSDFSFEIRVLRIFSKLGFKCVHSGSYIDPITNKYREFDIRAIKKKNNYRIKLAIECKNLSPYFPLVAHCRKRTKEESYHDILQTEPLTKRSHISYYPLTIKYDYKSTFYKNEEYIAKSIDQIGRHASENTIINNDMNTFEKISQAINSSYDLIMDSPKEMNDNNLQFFILPVLIIPDDNLWAIFYDEDGNTIKDPESINHISYYIGRNWTTSIKSNSQYSISHLEIVTFSYIEKFINSYFSDEDDWDDVFSK